MWISQENGNRRGTQSDQIASPPGPQASNHSLKFPRSNRLLKRADFKEIRSAAPRFYGKALVISYRLSTHPKLGITASRSFGKAHKRNHFKRLVREAFRTHQHALPPYEMVVLPKRGLETYSLALIVDDFLSFTCLCT